MRIDKGGFELFDTQLKEYGGHGHFIAGVIFRWRLSYLNFRILKQFKFKISHEDKQNYYDGYHNHIDIGFLRINYGT